MAETTVAELLREVRKPGKIVMPVAGGDDVFNITVEKADLIVLLTELSGEEFPQRAPWYVVRRANGFLHLDIQDREIV